MHAHTLARLELEEIKTELRILIGEKETCLQMNASMLLRTVSSGWNMFDTLTR